MEMYNKNQWNKGDGKSKCRKCVDDMLAKEASEQNVSNMEDKLEKARAHVAAAQASGNVRAVVKAESELAALQAELVTGLKPVRMASGRGSHRRTGGQGPTTRRR
jgi:predicted metal-dependent peptidase